MARFRKVARTLPSGANSIIASPPSSSPVRIVGLLGEVEQAALDPGQRLWVLPADGHQLVVDRDPLGLRQRGPLDARHVHAVHVAGDPAQELLHVTSSACGCTAWRPSEAFPCRRRGRRAQGSPGTGGSTCRRLSIDLQAGNLVDGSAAITSGR